MRRVALALMLVAGITGCLGTGGLGGKAKSINLSVVENKWGREAIFLGMQILYVYRVCAVLDLLIFNSVEFWSGSNPINGRSALAELPKSEAVKIGLNDVERATVERIDENDAKLHVEFSNGDRMGLDVHREGDSYTVSYLGRELYRGRIETHDLALEQGGF